MKTDREPNIAAVARAMLEHDKAAIAKFDAENPADAGMSEPHPLEVYMDYAYIAARLLGSTFGTQPR